MSNVINYHTSEHPTGLRFGHMAGFIKLILRRLKDRREMNYLLSLSDYQLKDIGVQRGDIQREALKPLWRT
jgi:uncharacterized protein YjiS (DUF1127 family)